MNFLKRILWTMGIWWKHLMKLAWIKLSKGYKLENKTPHYLYFIQDWFEIQFCNITLFISFHIHVPHVIKIKFWTFEFIFLHISCSCFLFWFKFKLIFAIVCIDSYLPWKSLCLCSFCVHDIMYNISSGMNLKERNIQKFVQYFP